MPRCQFSLRSMLAVMFAIALLIPPLEFVARRMTSGQATVAQSYELWDTHRLYLASLPLTETTLARLKARDDWRFVSLNSTSFSKSDLHHLDHLVELRELQLNGTRVTNEDVAYLACSHQLELLTLNDTSVTDIAVPYLSRMGSLKKLHLHHTGVSEVGLATLREALPGCKVEWSPVRDAQHGVAAERSHR